jgi:hypothetical protein
MVTRIDKPCRGLLRFSLRTLFLLVTIVCVWLGLQVQWLRDRGDALRWIEGNGGNVVKEDAPFRWALPDGAALEGAGLTIIDHAKAPWSIRLMGAETIYWIDVPRTDDNELVDAKIRELRNLFPEADIR